MLLGRQPKPIKLGMVGGLLGEVEGMFAGFGPMAPCVLNGNGKLFGSG